MWEQLPRQLLREPRYAVRRTEERNHDAAVLAGSEPVGTAEEAAVAAIAAAAGLAGPARRRCPRPAGRAHRRRRWVCRLVTDFVTETRIEGTAVSRASLTALWTGPM